MKTPSSSSSRLTRPITQATKNLPPNLAEWLAFGQWLARPGRADTTARRHRLTGPLHVSGDRSGQARQRIGLALALVACLSAPLHADSLWKDDAGPTLFADKKAVALGDILTIVVAENTSNSKSTSTKTAKTSATDTSIASFLYGPAASGLLTKGGKYPALKFDNKNSFDGGGQIANSETIAARVAVRVIDVLPNKNLVIEGTRHTAYSGEQQDIVLRGTVRADDVQANNTVFSYNVADATIKIVGKGAVSDSQKRGWFTKFWEKITPF